MIQTVLTFIKLRTPGYVLGRNVDYDTFLGSAVRKSYEFTAARHPPGQ